MFLLLGGKLAHNIQMAMKALPQRRAAGFGMASDGLTDGAREDVGAVRGACATAGDHLFGDAKAGDFRFSRGIGERDNQGGHCQSQPEQAAKGVAMRRYGDQVHAVSR